MSGKNGYCHEMCEVKTVIAMKNVRYKLLLPWNDSGKTVTAIKNEVKTVIAMKNVR